MAEFDKRGFAAVDAFFGEKTGTHPSEDAATGQSSSQNQHQEDGGPKRLGLGATEASAAKSSLSTLETSGLNRRILQMGNKTSAHKRPRGANDDDDEDENSRASDRDDDEEEDLGRTAIEQSSSQQQLVSASVLAKKSAERELLKKKKQRKKGKKERAQEQASQDEPSLQQGTKEEEAKERQDEEVTVDDQQKKSSKKRKRRKVRSRQKNIYKDKRETKPKHLILGSKNYQGRPLTAETRSKLNLESRSSSKAAAVDTWKSNWHNADDSMQEIEALPLAADAIDSAAIIKEDQESAPPQKKAYSRQGHSKKSKYKNLR